MKLQTTSGNCEAPCFTSDLKQADKWPPPLSLRSLGGWVAPNIYYLGNAGCVQFGGLRIAGLSGIYKESDYGKGGCQIS